MVETIKSTEERMRYFANAAWEAILIHQDGILVEANDQFYSMFGYDKESDSSYLKGMNIIHVFFSQESSETLRKHIFDNVNVSCEVQAKRKDGTSFPAEILIKKMKYKNQKVHVAAIRNITDRKKMAELMVQTEKMMSVGGLAAGMAHEINNPLAGMIQTANVLANRLSNDINLTPNIKAANTAGISMEALSSYMESRNIPRMIASINTSGKRVAEIVDNMLSFARKSDSDVSNCSLPDLIDRTVELASTDYNLKKKYDFKLIKITRRFEENLQSVPCEMAKIQQVLLNILHNGAESMHEMGIESPEIILRTLYDDETKMARIEIENNGPPIPEEIKNRIFEPFFTTKPIGTGTGLGLSVSYFIITENHKGTIRLESEPGMGTNFIINLPLI